ncbi:hypothetical protein TNCV_1690021 [Trichonephila clavipes]|nr:hypothetical protein TNCV_1690021 [Trichonephila clavipes]
MVVIKIPKLYLRYIVPDILQLLLHISSILCAQNCWHTLSTGESSQGFANYKKVSTSERHSRGSQDDHLQRYYKYSADVAELRADILRAAESVIFPSALR